LPRDESNRTEEEYCISRVSKEGKENALLRVREGLDHSLEIAEAAGISPDSLILDPGIGFAKSTRESLLLIRNLKDIMKEGEIWMMAASRKSV
ncbi:dihydropteroate synthase, partial [Enterococcus faecium]